MRTQNGLQTLIGWLPVPLATAVALGGCSFIGQTAFEEKRNALDHDGDGAPFGCPPDLDPSVDCSTVKDCDDNNALRSPAFAEVPYDGWDNDCDGTDIVDQDADGFAGIDKALYLTLTPDAVWPQMVADGPVDCADDAAVWPTAGDIYPENLNDPPYDGIDGDCAADNDYDLDGDGYMPDTAQFGGQTVTVADEFEAYSSVWGYTPQGGPVFGDCDDFDPQVNPGRLLEDEIYYDGVDTNCDGLNDYDADGDGYMPPADLNTGLAINQAEYINFLQAFHDGVAPWEELWNDCLDVAHPVLTSAVPADIYPGAVDVPYDGIDADCSCCDDDDLPFDPPSNDFDADTDGFMPDTADFGGATLDVPTEFTAYITNWTQTADGELVIDYNVLSTDFQDCDDDDPATYPGGLEVLDDSADGDCSGDPNATPFGFDFMQWDTVRTPQIVRTDTDYVLVTTADDVDISQATTLVQKMVGVALTFDLDAGYQAIVNRNGMIWMGQTNQLPMGLTLDAVADGPNFWGGASYSFTGQTSYLTANRKDFSQLIGNGIYVNGPFNWEDVSSNYTATSVDLEIDAAGHPWATACDADIVHAIHGDAITNGSVDSVSWMPDLTGVGGPSAGICFFNSPPDDVTGLAEVVICDPGVDCVMHDFDTTSLPPTLDASATNPWLGYAIEEASFEHGWHNLRMTGATGAQLQGSLGTYTVLTDYNLTSFDSSWRDTDTNGIEDTLYTVGVGTLVSDGSGPHVVLAYGDPNGILTERILDFSDPTRPNLVPTGASVFADDGRLMVAVAADSLDYLGDAVGWVFFGLP
jgi:hypothetical protein